MSGRIERHARNSHYSRARLRGGCCGVMVGLSLTQNSVRIGPCEATHECAGAMHAGVSLSAKRKREQVRQRYPASDSEYPEHYRAHYAFLRSLSTFAAFTRLAQSEGWFLQQASSAGDGQRSNHRYLPWR